MPQESMGIIRELLLNPINHKQYEKGVPIQISVFEDHIELFNVGTWPESIPVDEGLYQRHESIPYNPKVADAFYRAGEIESWGRGFLKIRLECEKVNAKLPDLSKTGSGITVRAFACEQYLHIFNDNKAASVNKIIKEASVLVDSDGGYITDNDGIPLVMEKVRELSEEEKGEMNKRKAIYEHVLEICSEKLSEREKKHMLSIIEYLETHDEIDRATAEIICGKGTTTTVGYLNKLIEIEVLQKQKESVATIYRIAGL